MHPNTSQFFHILLQPLRIPPLQKVSKRRIKNLRAGEIAQWIRALTALSEVLSSNPSNHMVAHEI